MIRRCGGVETGVSSEANAGAVVQGQTQLMFWQAVCQNLVKVQLIPLFLPR